MVYIVQILCTTYNLRNTQHTNYFIVNYWASSPFPSLLLHKR